AVRNPESGLTSSSRRVVSNRANQRPKNEYILEDIDGQKSDDRPDIISRVFSIKLMELINDIKRRHIFGRVTA
ncbi:hypothetical protein PIB30_104565, partial [Stylosanthes scabra]|nr:hypothetical protein [Stylosanthes scabra]